MGNPFPVNINDGDGVTRLSGEADFTDPANQPGGGLPSEWTVGPDGGLRMDLSAGAGNEIGIYLTVPAGQTSDVLVLDESGGGDAGVSVQEDYSVHIQNDDINNNILDVSTANGQTIFAISDFGVLINPDNPGATALTANYATNAQTVPVLDAEGINGSTRVFAKGHLVINNHAAPVDGDLAAGDCALWFDQTNGAAKLMVKAKQADGTVVTAAIALA
jgi:hypothetical protein